MTAITPAILPAIRPAIRSVFAPGGGLINPATLNPSAWYSRRELNTLFQDSAGTLAVSAAGQPIGLGLDRTSLAAPQPQLVSNPGGPFVDTSGWPSVAGSTASVVGGALRATLTGTSNPRIATALTGLQIGGMYRVDYNMAPGFSLSSIVVRAATTPDITTGSAADTTVPVAGGSGSLFFLATAATMYVGAIGVTSTVGAYVAINSMAVKFVPGNHQRQATTTARPTYQPSPGRAVFDLLDDVLVTTFASALGANCTVARAIPGVGAQILTGVNIGTTFNDTVTAVELLVFNRPLTASETAGLTAYLNAAAFSS